MAWRKTCSYLENADRTVPQTGYLQNTPFLKCVTGERLPKAREKEKLFPAERTKHPHLSATVIFAFSAHALMLDKEGSYSAEPQV